ncbi:MAG: zinc ribbon domain-containing protein [Nitrospirae bacterium]|nr:zinc ribbon domain-containing protein [Nitrospirota bacterium]
MENCPECLSPVASEASVCAACGRRIKGKPCPECGELSRTIARKCQYCGHSFAREERVARFEPYRTKASLLPTLFLRGRLIPQEIHLTPDKIVIRSWGFFWLSRTDEESPWEKIAGYHYHSGWFWDGVEIQTRGQRASIITCLRKPDGAHVKRILEQMKE